ncbi:DUF3142 domain-containing protein [Luteolibacter sp. LG18]|uniref:DUF3142 domain-containing protein n=1 Tax=Luteolibacter sp. LG18 TaxID=2819286 RepID=UPI0030C6DF59
MPHRWLILLALFLTACRKEAPRPAPAIEAYVWQSPARSGVATAIERSRGAVATLHVRAAEMRWTGKTFDTNRAITGSLPTPGCGLVLRIGASASQLEWTPDQIAPVAKVVKELAALGPKEIQCDYDCPQSRLDRYSRLLDSLQTSAGNVPLVPTTLPSWLDEPTFRKLVAKHPGYVLQVHSLQLPKQAGQPVMIFDPSAARSAAKKASALGVPFRIAMATYGCEVWFGSDGKVMEVVSEDTAPLTKAPASRAYALADPTESARLVREWSASPPSGLQAVIWYRLPVEGDRRNWPWVTFQHVIRGEEAAPDLTLESTDHDGTFDLHIVNRGDFPVPLPADAIVTTPVISADGVGAYRLEKRADGMHYLRRDGIWPWLDPGKKIPAGWLRTHEPVSRIDWHFTP